METRILLVDDHEVVRDALRILLERRADLSVVGEAADGAEACEVFEEVRPDVTVMDIWMPRQSGIVATQRILAQHPTARVLMLSMHDKRSFVEESLGAGASGYVVKTAPTRELLDAIDAVRRGGVFLSPVIARHAVAPLAGADAGGSPLTLREREVLQHIAEGLGSKEIAGRLHLSSRTVDTHRVNIMKKLGIHKTSGLVRFAIREGLVAP
jgi:DNA-binding NarL/FixJ family response regulator